MSGQLHALAALTLEKESVVLIWQRARWAPELVWMWGWRGKDPHTCQKSNPSGPAYSCHYTDQTTLAPKHEECTQNFGQKTWRVQTTQKTYEVGRWGWCIWFRTGGPPLAPVLNMVMNLHVP